MEQWTKGLFYIGIIAWGIAASFHLVSTPTLYLFLGLLILMVGLKNAYLLYQAHRKGNIHIKIRTMMDRMGERQGMLYYATFMVALFLVAGLLLVVYGVLN